MRAVDSLLITNAKIIKCSALNQKFDCTKKTVLRNVSKSVILRELRKLHCSGTLLVFKSTLTVHENELFVFLPIQNQIRSERLGIKSVYIMLLGPVVVMEG